MKYLVALLAFCCSSFAYAQSPCEGASPDSLMFWPNDYPYTLSDSAPFESSILIDCVEEGVLLDEMSFEICMFIEHSYIGDLEMILTLPDSSELVLINRIGDDNCLGNPIDVSDDDLLGETWKYCWSLDAEHESMENSLETIIASLSNQESMLPGTYLPQSGLESLACSSINGMWTLKIVDHLAIDNGYITNWSINLIEQESAVYSCEGICLNDADLDSICDEFDNCVAVPNFNQMDVDNNGVGDACDYEDEIGLLDYLTSKNTSILKIIDVLGRELDESSPIKSGQILFYIYEDGSVEKKIELD